MDIALDRDVTAAGEVGGVLVADGDRLDRGLPDRILGAVDETDEVA